MARARKIETPQTPEGCWIKYQMDLKKITMEAVAQKAGCSLMTVSRVVAGKQNAEKAKKAKEVLAEMLGYKTFLHLWREAFIQTGRIPA
jgi:transcriptional regulator with XRE-family HTH domain